MNNEKSQSIKVQDTFLNYLRKSKMPTNVFLCNGIKLTGIVLFFDNFSIVLGKNNSSQIVYKHAISTIVPEKSVNAMNVMPSDGESVSDNQNTFLGTVT